MPRPLAVVLACLLLAGCGPSGRDDLAARDEIEEALREYLPRLGQVYTGQQYDLLEGYAAAKEIAGVRKRIDDLAAQGRVLEPELQQFTVEDWNAWSHSNAYATTVEVWDLRVYSTGTHQLLSQEIGQRNRVKYQLKRDDDGRWLVLFRSIVKSPGG